mmetsp:Transcript_65396/g.181913  ORF Transcript_65396/g.181913 Transcript_65396/m.181913 type:complete len:324 (+) Transcript_65396:998-1969(+)
MCVVFPPGAAHMSRTLSPGVGASTRTAMADGICCKTKQPRRESLPSATFMGAKGRGHPRRCRTLIAVPLAPKAKIAERSMRASPLATRTAGGFGGPSKSDPRVGARVPSGPTHIWTAHPAARPGEAAMTPMQKTSAPRSIAIAQAASMMTWAAPGVASATGANADSQGPVVQTTMRASGQAKHRQGTSNSSRRRNSKHGAAAALLAVPPELLPAKLSSHNLSLDSASPPTPSLATASAVKRSDTPRGGKANARNNSRSFPEAAFASRPTASWAWSASCTQVGTAATTSSMRPSTIPAGSETVVVSDWRGHTAADITAGITWEL